MTIDAKPRERQRPRWVVVAAVVAFGLVTTACGDHPVPFPVPTGATGVVRDDHYGVASYLNAEGQVCIGWAVGHAGAKSSGGSCDPMPVAGGVLQLYGDAARDEHLIIGRAGPLVSKVVLRGQGKRTVTLRTQRGMRERFVVGRAPAWPVARITTLGDGGDVLASRDCQDGFGYPDFANCTAVPLAPS